MRVHEHMHEIYLRILTKRHKWMHDGNEYVLFLFIECKLHLLNL